MLFTGIMMMMMMVMMESSGKELKINHFVFRQPDRRSSISGQLSQCWTLWHTAPGDIFILFFFLFLCFLFDTQHQVSYFAYCCCSCLFWHTAPGDMHCLLFLFCSLCFCLAASTRCHNLLVVVVFASFWYCYFFLSFCLAQSNQAIFIIVVVVVFCCCFCFDFHVFVWHPAQGVIFCLL